MPPNPQNNSPEEPIAPAEQAEGKGFEGFTFVPDLTRSPIQQEADKAAAMVAFLKARYSKPDLQLKKTGTLAEELSNEASATDIKTMMMGSKIKPFDPTKTDIKKLVGDQGEDN